jgi:hypothetical protein
MDEHDPQGKRHLNDLLDTEKDAPEINDLRVDNEPQSTDPPF